MSRGVNKVILVGNLGGDPDVRYTASGTAVTTIQIATSDQWTDKQSGEHQERTEWHRVKLFGKLAEVAGEYLKKGRQVYVEGSLRRDKYTDRDGIERYTTDVIASEMQMLGGQPNDRPRDRPSDSYGESRYGGAGSRGQTGKGRAQRDMQEHRAATAEAAAPEGGDGFTDDDIPF